MRRKNRRPTKTSLIFAFFSPPLFFKILKWRQLLDFHNIFGLLCLKQAISFYIPQLLQLKKKKHLSVLISPSYPAWFPCYLFCLFVCFISPWRQAQRILLKCIFSSHSSKQAVWFGSSSQQEITAGPARRYETHRWVTRCWKQSQPRRWTQQSHRSGNSQQQVSRCLFAAILAAIFRN